MLGRQIHSPLDLERRFGLIGGDIFHGKMGLDQLFSARPMIGACRLPHAACRASICAARARIPGGGVTGAPGHNAAQRGARRPQAVAAARRERPLDGIRVLDLSRVLAGPWCTQLLADMGADVIKVERPGVGDDTRHWGPPWHERGRREGRRLFPRRQPRQEVGGDRFRHGRKAPRSSASSPQRCDVVVENFKVGGLAKFGLDAASLRAANPRLIVASITGFGQDGPYADRAGYDFIIQGMGGMMSITGLPDGEPGGGPMRVGVAVADLFTGMYAASAILAALVRRGATGEGAHIDMALFDTQLAVLANQASQCSGLAARTRRGRAIRHPNIVPYQPFDAADQPIIIAVGNDRQFARLAEILRRAGMGGRRALRDQCARASPTARRWSR